MIKNLFKVLALVLSVLGIAKLLKNINEHEILIKQELDEKC